MCAFSQCLIHMQTKTVNFANHQTHVVKVCKLLLVREYILFFAHCVISDIFNGQTQFFTSQGLPASFTWTEYI